MNKLLAFLLVLWCALTIQIAIENAVLKDEAQFNLQWRAFLVYSNTLSGCMTGAYYAKFDFSFIPMYKRCLALAYNEKDIYLSKWKVDDN